MTSSSALLFSEWKVFLDGVEVPHLGFSITFTTDSGSQAVISLEPDWLLSKLRPQTVVHIFCRQQYPKDPDNPSIEDDFILFWEGYTIGSDHTKNPTTRSYSLQCVGLLTVLDQYKAFAVGIGPAAFSSAVSGSDNVPTLTTDAFIGVDAEMLTGPLIYLEDIMKQPNTEITYSQRLLEIVKRLCGFNSLLRQNVIRFRLLDKIAGIPDTVVGNLVSQRLIAALFQNVTSAIMSENTVMDVVRYIESFAFYHYSCIPAPVTEATVMLTPDVLSTYYSVTNKVKEAPTMVFPEGAKRADIIFHPMLYASLPPPCNFIFPDQLSSLSVTRNKLVEPTRYFLLDPTVEDTNVGFLGYFAPDHILRNRPSKTPNLWGMSDFVYDPTTATTSAYLVKSRDGSQVNILNSFSEDEIERGLLAKVTKQGDQEQYVALAAQQLDGHLSRSVYERDQISLVNYLYELNRFAGMTANVSLSGHRWIVPGFPAMIFDGDISYHGNVVSTTFSVAPTGSEVTAVVLDYARAIPKIDFALLKAVNKHLSIIQPLMDGIKEDRAAVSAKIEQLRAQIVLAHTKILTQLLVALNDEVIDKGSLIENIAACQEVYWTIEQIYGSTEELRKEDSALVALFNNVQGSTIPARLAWANNTISQEVIAPDTVSSFIDVFTEAKTRLLAVSTEAKVLDKAVNSSHPIFAGVLAAASKTSKLAEAVGNSVDDLITNYDLAIPPAFYNENLIVLSELDNVYEQLLGCQPFYSGVYAQQLETLDTVKEQLSNDRPEEKRLRLVLEYIKGLLLINRVFPIFGPSDVNLPTWNDFNHKAKDTVSAVEWEHRNFLIRKGTTLGEFLKQNGLVIQTAAAVLSNSGPRDEYLILQPQTAAKEWDDTIFSKLVDEQKMSGSGQDAGIAEVRASLPRQTLLKTAFRQDLIVDYSSKHFGKRGFDGT